MLTTDRPSDHLSTDQCAVQIMNVIPWVTRFLRSEIRYHGQPLSLSQLRVLNYLERWPQSSLSEVAEYLDVTRPTMSTMIDRLVQRGVVHRMEDPQERRRILLSLTPEGNEQLQQVTAATRAKVAVRLAQFTEPQLEQLMQGLALLGDAFQDAQKL
ncbi:MarR family transcriptional regulator [filamentous cyanobacterium CCP1]|nr:MarR family transcriptional regulator [filamentous cyanobacterium CCP2]PSB64507.1 MarR family transcriptional regulator [filamentous cyanobacterium CCP1]